MTHKKTRLRHAIPQHVKLSEPNYIGLSIASLHGSLNRTRHQHDWTHGNHDPDTAIITGHVVIDKGTRGNHGNANRKH